MRRSLLLVCWVLTDVILFVGAYLLAYFLRVGFILSSDFPLEQYLQIVIFITPAWLGMLAFTGTFRLLTVQTSSRNILFLLASCVIGLSLFSLSYYFAYQTLFSRLLLAYAGVLSFGGVAVWHLAFDQWQRSILRKNPPSYPLLIVGANREAEKLIRLLEERRSPLKPVAILDSRGTHAKELNGVPIKGKLNKLEDVIRSDRITHVMQCDELEHTINLLSVARQHGITYFLLPFVLGITGSEQSTQLEGVPVLMVRE